MLTLPYQLIHTADGRILIEVRGGGGRAWPAPDAVGVEFAAESELDAYIAEHGLANSLATPTMVS